MRRSVATLLVLLAILGACTNPSGGGGGGGASPAPAASQPAVDSAY